MIISEANRYDPAVRRLTGRIIGGNAGKLGYLLELFVSFQTCVLFFQQMFFGSWSGDHERSG